MSCALMCIQRPSSVFLLPSSTRDASVECTEPTGNCLRELILPLVLPDVRDGSTQCTLPDDSAFKCSRFDSVNRFVQGFEEAELSAKAAFKELCNQVNAVNDLKPQVAQLEQRIVVLSDENEALFKRTFELSEDVATLCYYLHTSSSTCSTTNFFASSTTTSITNKSTRILP